MAAIPPKDRRGDRDDVSASIFADLRRRNERAARVAQMLAAKRTRQIEHAIRVQRQRRTHQAR